MFCNNNYSSQPLQLVPSLLPIGEEKAWYTRATYLHLFPPHWRISFAKYDIIYHSKNRIVILTINLSRWLQMSEPI